MRLFNVGCEKLLKAGFAQQLLHGGDAEDFSLIRIETRALNSGGDCGFTGVPAVGAALDQLPAGERRTADCLLERVFLHIGCPGGQSVDLAENIGDLLISEERRGLEFVPGKSQVRFGALSALGFRLAEPAPLTTAEGALTFISKLRLLSQFTVCPFVQVGLVHLIHADVGLPRLIDGHADSVDVVDAIEDFQSAQGIEHHLWITLCKHEASLPVFVIADVQNTIRNDDAVCRAEALFDPA